MGKQGIDQRVGSAVKAELARAGHYQAALSTVLNLSSNTVYSRLRGESSFTVSELLKVAEFLAVDVALFVPAHETAAAA